MSQTHDELQAALADQTKAMIKELLSSGLLPNDSIVIRNYRFWLGGSRLNFECILPPYESGILYEKRHCSDKMIKTLYVLNADITHLYRQTFFSTNMSQTKLINNFKDKYNRDRAYNFPVDTRRAVDEDFIKALVNRLNDLSEAQVWKYRVGTEDRKYYIESDITRIFYVINFRDSKGEIIEAFNSFAVQTDLYTVYCYSNELRYEAQKQKRLEESKLSSLEANKQPAKAVSDELEALCQIAVELNNYFDGLVDVELNVKTKAISLKLDKLGGFQVDNYIKYSSIWEKWCVKRGFSEGESSLWDDLQLSDILDYIVFSGFLENLKYRA